MACNYSGCNKPGAYNCMKCGNMYCEMHSNFDVRRNKPVVCDDCLQMEHEASGEGRKSVRGCSRSVLLISLLLLILGFITDILTSSPAHVEFNSVGAALVVLGVIGLIIGGILFIMALA